MDIVLGVSMTPTTVRMVLVQGDKADGFIVENDVFDFAASAAPRSGSSEQVSAAILGTRQNALDSGHHLVASGVTWSDRAELVMLRESLIARGLEDVLLVPEIHAAGALAQAIGEAVGHDSTALLFITPDTATLSIVDTADGSMVKMLSRRLNSADAMPELTEIVTSQKTRVSQAQGLTVVGSGVDAASMKPQLEKLVSVPVNVPEDAEFALARGAALVAGTAPSFEASTTGMAYSLDPEGATAVPASFSELIDADTQLAPVGYIHTDTNAIAKHSDDARDSRKPFIPVGSLAAAIVVMGVVAIIMSLAVSIRPTAGQLPSPGEQAMPPNTAAPAPPPVQRPAQPVSPATAAPQPPPAIIPEPVPVVQEAAPAAPQRAAPRTVYVQAPAPKPRAPAAAPAPKPRAPAPAPKPQAPAPTRAAPPPAPAPAAPPPAPVQVPATSAPVLPTPTGPPPQEILSSILQLPVVQAFLPRPVYRQPPVQVAPRQIVPQQQWPVTPPQTPQYPQYPQYPSQPQYPQYPSQPQYPQYPSGPGGYGSALWPE